MGWQQAREEINAMASELMAKAVDNMRKEYSNVF